MQRLSFCGYFTLPPSFPPSLIPSFPPSLPSSLFPPSLPPSSHLQVTDLHRVVSEKNGLGFTENLQQRNLCLFLLQSTDPLLVVRLFMGVCKNNSHEPTDKRGIIPSQTRVTYCLGRKHIWPDACPFLLLANQKL